MQPKVEVGQVWHRPDVPGVGRYKITKIEKGSAGRLVCYAVYAISPNQWGKESTFGTLKGDGTPFDWDEGWTVESVHALTVPRSLSSSTKKDEADFFRASSHPDLCSKCAAPLPCSYH
jgi:hypothetical protein